HLLGDLLGIGAAAEHASRQAEDARQMPIDQGRTGRAVAGAHAAHQLEIGILDRSGRPPLRQTVLRRFARGATPRRRRAGTIDMTAPRSSVARSWRLFYSGEPSSDQG